MKINPMWEESMRAQTPVDCMPNITMCIKMTDYLFEMDKRKYTTSEMTEQIMKCWDIVLKVNHRDDKKC